MSQEPQQEHISKKLVVYKMPGMDDVNVRRDETYRTTDAGALTMDLYYPQDAKSGARMPAIVVVAGYPDPGYERILGCKFKEMGWTISWARLAAASGLVAIAYTNREPAADLQALLQYVRKNAASLSIDEDRIGVLAGSGNVPLALSTLMQDPKSTPKCGVLCYGYTLDLDGSTAIADAARQWGFAYPSAGKSVDDLQQDVPLFVARASQDDRSLNEAIDRFVMKALARSLPLTLVNHPGPHAFDLFQDTEISRETVRQILSFMRFHLRA